ncbi:MAG: hypothetical protein FJ118_12745 [Deltaproteobacteria bacterium]|nr:hypothetical protein [Deltaproteobacteria bacterium]
MRERLRFVCLAAIVSALTVTIMEAAVTENAQAESQLLISEPAPGEKEHRESREAPGPAAKTDEVEQLKQKILDIQNKGKLGFRKVVPCSSVEGYGLYAPLKPDEPATRVIFYFEPQNVSTLITGDRYVIDLTVSLFILDTAGKVVGGKENMLKISRVSHSPVLDLFYKMDLKAREPLSQDLIVRTVLRDNIKNETVSATYRLNVRSKGQKLLDRI